MCVLPCAARSFTRGHTHTHAHTHTHTLVHTTTHAHTHIHTHTHAHTHAHAYAHAQTHTHTQTQTTTQTHTHSLILGTASHLHLTSMRSSPSSGSIINRSIICIRNSCVFVNVRPAIDLWPKSAILISKFHIPVSPNNDPYTQHMDANSWRSWDHMLRWRTRARHMTAKALHTTPRCVVCNCSCITTPCAPGTPSIKMASRPYKNIISLSVAKQGCDVSVKV